jgi:hypothetical protein
VFLESLALNLCVTAGDTLSFFTESADVRATIPDKEGLSILAETQVALVSVPFGASEELHHIFILIFSIRYSVTIKIILTKWDS